MLGQIERITYLRGSEVYPVPIPSYLRIRVPATFIHRDIVWYPGELKVRPIKPPSPYYKYRRVSRLNRKLRIDEGKRIVQRASEVGKDQTTDRADVQVKHTTYDSGKKFRVLFRKK